MLWTKLQSHQTELVTLQKDLSTSHADIRQLQQSNESLVSQQKLFTQAVTDTSSQAQGKLAALTEQLDAIKGSSRKDWLLAEVEYLLRIANQRLLIESDPQASESLLLAADKVLNEIADPSLMPVRMAIAEELFALQSSALKQVDTLYSQLSALSNAVHSLELSYQGDRQDQSKLQENASTEATPSTEIAPSEKGPVARFLQKLSDAFSNAVRIQHSDHVIEAPPTPDFSEYLKQNLALQLEQVKLSLIKQNGVRYNQELDDTLQWARQSLPSNNSQAQHLISKLEELSNHTLNWTKPDISKSLSLLQTRIEEMYRRHELNKASKPSAPSNSTDEESTP